MALVYHHVTRRAELLAEVRRVLKRGGALLVSTTHPVTEWNPDDRPYFSSEQITIRPKASQHTITFWHLTLEQFIGELLEAGFTLAKLVEPRAIDEAQSIDPIRHAKTQRTPIFLAVRLIRRE
jgi:ubiquinone/menaquinone biosynthesis C-methylase UbiE